MKIDNEGFLRNNKTGFSPFAVGFDSKNRQKNGFYKDEPTSDSNADAFANACGCGG